MGNYIYTVPVAYAPQDNRTYAAKRNYKFQECKNTLNSNENELWCNIMCGNDDEYCNPYYKGEKVYFQYFADNNTLWKIIPKIFDSVTGLLLFNIPGLITVETGTSPDKTTYYNVIIDTNLLPVDTKCWYLKVGLFNCQPNQALYDACILAHTGLGQSPEQAEWECSIELCGPGYSENISEPYCELPACEVPTLLIEGVYPKYDCNKHYYGKFDTGSPTNSYKSQVRIYGTIEQIGIDIEETVVSNNERVSGKKIDKYRLQTGKVPPYVAKIIGNCFAANEVYVNGVKYSRAISVQKTNDEGQMWIITTDLLIYCDENKFTCK